MSADQTPIFLSLVVPAYNEAKRIGPSLDKIVAYLAGQDYRTEVIVVDDGSRDGTAEVVKQGLEGKVPYHLLRNDPNLGKALSVKRGLQAAQGRYVLFSDADLSTPIEEATRLVAALQEGADVAIASRQLPGSKLAIHQPWYREIAGRLFGRFNQFVLLPGIPDSQCGFKAFTHEAVEKILPHQKLTGWAFDAELLYIARRLGLKIAQIPVTWINDPASKVNMLRDGFKMVADLLRIRRLHRDLKG